MIKSLVLTFTLFLTTCIFSQNTDLQIAQFYYGNSEFDKALPYFEKVFSQDKSKFNFYKYLDCLTQVGDKKGAEKLLKKMIQLNDRDIEFTLELASFYEKNQEQKEADKIYEKLLKEELATSYQVKALYEQLSTRNKDELSFQLLKDGRKKFKDELPLHFYFADYYLRKGDFELMTDEYIAYLSLDFIDELYFQIEVSKKIDFLNDENQANQLFTKKLLEKTQKKPDNARFADMLIWLFTQKKQFSAAIMQAQAIDKREKNGGMRVFELGNVCLQNKNFKDAIKAYQYILALGNDSPLYFQAEYALLNSRFKELTELKTYSKEEIKATLSEYDKVLTRNGINNNSFNVCKEKAYIMAYFSDQANDALVLLNQLLDAPGLNQMQKAEVKMLAADIYVLSDDVWEASLLYMQIDKEFKFDPIGFEAKFKNARIFYYDGDFKFAQSQLDILKQATTKLIANDAMQLSVFITDNYGLDSNFVAMSRFAKADLLLEQHKYALAFQEYDSIMKDFPFHGLADEISYRKAQAMQEQGNFEQALQYLEEILKYHAQDILADDALFKMATIYEVNLQNTEKASELYKKLLFEYKGSLYNTEARKRIRILRGDKVNEDDL